MNYLHVFDLKPPGIHFMFSLIQSIAGESMLAARVIDIFWQILTGFVIYAITLRLTNDRYISVFSSIASIFLYFRQDYWHTLQADGSLNLFFAITVLLFISSQNKHSFLKILLAGICFAAVLLFKYTVVSFIPLLILALAADKKFVLSLRVKNIFVFVSGMIFLFGGVLSVYYFTGALDAFIDIQLVQTPLYTGIAYETESFSFISGHLFKLFTHSAYTPLLLLSVFSLIYAFIKKDMDFEKILIFSWLFTSLFSLIVQWKFYNYHFLVIIPSISICGAYGLFNLKNLLLKNKNFYKAAFIFYILIFVILAFKPYGQNYINIKDYINGMADLDSFYIKNGFTSDSVFMYSKTIEAVKIAQKNSVLEDKIYVWGFDPLIYYISQRYCSSRFIYNFPLLWKGENSNLKNEFLTAIERDKPKLIIVAKNDPLFYISGFNEDSKQLLKRFPQFDNIINLKYDYLTSVVDYEVYERKEW